MTNDSALVPASEPSADLVHMPLRSRDYNLLDLWKVVSRRRLWILTSVAVALALGVIYNLVVPRLYRATAQLQILKQDAATDLSDPAQAAGTAAADALDFNLAVQTDVNVLRSRNMALRVVHELNLDHDADYQLRGDAEENGRSLEDSPKRLAYVVERFNKRLSVDSVSGTRLLAVSFMDRDAKRAAAVVNQLLSDFIDYNYQLRFVASTQATGYLGNQLQAMKAQVDAAQANVTKLQQASGIYGVDETNNAVNAKLQQLNSQLTLAESNRAVKESIYKLALTRSPEVLAGMIGTQANGTTTANAPLQLLRQQQADAQANYADLSSHYGSQYPKVIQANQRLQSIQASIDKEMNRLVGQATAEYKVAADTEAAASRALAAQKADATQMNRDAVLYTSAKHDADTSRDLYEKLQQRLKEAGILSSLHSTNLNILDRAIAPSKYAQSIVLSLLIALAAGIVLGLIGAFGSEAFDTAVRDPQKIEETLGVPVLGLLPPVETVLPRVAIQALRKHGIGPSWQYQVTAKAPRSRVAEAFRVLRTSILFSLQRRPARVLAITSTSEGEGKSFTTFNLAAAFAQSGRTVLVIDADLRKRTLSVALDMQERDGLDQALSGDDWHQAVVSYPEMPGLFVMPAGRVGEYPADLLGSIAMAELTSNLRNSFDLVLVDTPSMLAVSDTLSLTTSVDAFVVLAQCGVTAQHSLARTLDMLQRAGARVLGVVLNGIDFRSADFYYYWGKTSSGYDAPSAQILTPVLPSRSTRKPVGIIVALAIALGLSCAPRSQAQISEAHPVVPVAPAAGTRTAGMSATDSAAAGSTVATADTDSQKVLIGAGDLLSISVYDAPELAQDVRVSSNGNVHLTILGDVHATGLQPDALAETIEVQLRERKLIQQPHVSVAIKEFTTQGVTIEGEVKKPGVYPIYAERSLLDMLAMADGLTPSADTHISIRRHGTGAVDKVLVSQNDPDLSQRSVRVYPGDVVIVPRAGLAYVLGDVQRPGGYIMHDDGRMSVIQAISEAQGTTKLASMKHVVLLHNASTGIVRTELRLDDILRGKRPDVPLENGDILFVPASGMKTFAQNTAGITSSVAGASLYTVR